MHAAVARQDRGGGLGVGGGEPGVERAGAVRGQLLLQTGADLGVGAGEVEVVDGAAHVEAGAADEDGGAALGEEPVDLGAGQALVLGDTGGLGDRPDVEQPVRDAAALGLGEFGGADVHAPVELHGVGVDDLAAEVLGEEDAQVRLAGWRSGRRRR